MQIKYLAFLVAAAFAQEEDPSATPAPITAQTLTARPGVCNSSGKECLKFGEDYQCVAVETSKPGISGLAQCVRKANKEGTNICVADQAGVCPTFSSWPANIRQVEPMCAFVPDPKCTKALTASGQIVSARQLQETPTSTKAPVNCYQAVYKYSNGSDAKVNGVYKCIDKDLYISKNYGLADTDKQVKACGPGNATTGFRGLLCNGKGTCSPTGKFSTQYACKCNQGYDPKDNCASIIGNVCENFGQCGALGQCNTTTGQCICQQGSKGNQCSKCDRNFPDKACGGPERGSCGLEDTCTCLAGYGGAQCEIKSVTTAPPKTTETPGAATTAAPSSAVAFGISAAALAVAAVMA